MIPAMVVFASTSAMLLGLPAPRVAAREAGIFRSCKINGVPAISILVIPALTTILHLVIVALIITATAPLFFDAPLPVNWVPYALVFFLTAFASAGLGVLIGVISSSARMTVLWSQLIYLPSMLLGGLMLPYEMLPPAMRRVAQLLPATHAMNAFGGLAHGQPVAFDPVGSLIVLLASGMLAFGLAVWLFNWDSHNEAQLGHPLLGLLALLPYALEALLLT